MGVEGKRDDNAKRCFPMGSILSEEYAEDEKKEHEGEEARYDPIEAMIRA